MTLAGNQIARAHPTISEFCNLVKEVAGDGVLDFEQVEQREFMRFWSRLLMTRYVSDADDFVITFWGTALREGYGEEVTGKLLSRPENGPRGEYLKRLHNLVMRGNKPIFASGKLDWKYRDFVSWYQVKMPLTHKGVRDGTISCVIFE
jgi:hypothetical protein